tara:strand:- start:176 stop:613 length:438 start_codon:yes stop_codon:yes gene_type:complete
LIKRKGRKGYLMFQQYERKEKVIYEGDKLLGKFIDYAGSQVNETLNHLLQIAAEEAGIQKRNSITFTNIRHTAFFIMVEEYRHLFNTESEVTSFAENGFTSYDMFKETYINKVDAEAKARKVRKATKRKTPKSDSQYEMIKRAYE